MFLRLSLLWASVSLVTASPLVTQTWFRRVEAELDRTAFEEAQQPDDSAVKAFAGTQIKTFDGRCLFVDALSGDFRANLTPIEVADCDTTDGQGWDIITSGKHNNAADYMLVVSTLTNACFNFDPRRPEGSQVILFSCGGRADGGGDVTDSQLFPYSFGAGPGSFSPRNDLQSCFTVKADAIGVGPCVAGNLDQMFTFEGIPEEVNDPAEPSEPVPSSQLISAPTTSQTAITTVTAAPPDPTMTASSIDAPASSPPATTDALTGGEPNPTQAVPVSRAGGTFQPTAAAESHERDDTATRAFTSVGIQAPNGQCLSIDPTAGDFRQNLIPISLVECAGTPNEKFEIVTAGRHNNAENSALVVSSLMNGCISFDGRRPAGDTVTVFSCGGRAAGEGETNNGQLFPFILGDTDLVLAPESERNATCIVSGDGRLDSAPCAGDGSQVFTILP